MAWRSNKREVASDPRDIGSITLFSRIDIQTLLEVTGYRLGKLIRGAGIKPVSGKGKTAKYTFAEFNRIVDFLRSQEDYEEPKIPGWRREKRVRA